MKNEKTPLPVCGTGSGEDGQIALEGFEAPHADFTSSSKKAQAISALLLRGSANGISLQQLQALTGLDERKIRRMILRERLGGACICINCRDGYFLAESEAERDSCARSMLHRATEIRRTAEAIAAAEVET